MTIGPRAIRSSTTRTCRSGARPARSYAGSRALERALLDPVREHAADAIGVRGHGFLEVERRAALAGALPREPGGSSVLLARVRAWASAPSGPGTRRRARGPPVSWSSS